MDFKWVVDALRRGLKVTRRSWAGNGTQFLYKESGSSITKQRGPYVFNWEPTGEELLYATDWEEYVEPKKEPAKAGKDWTDCAGGVVCTGEDTGYMAEQLELLADIYAEKISQRVVQLLQKAVSC